MSVTKFKSWWHLWNLLSKQIFVTKIICENLLPKLICCPTINDGSCWISLKLEVWKKSKSKVNWPFARLKSCSRVELETVLSFTGYKLVLIGQRYLPIRVNNVGANQRSIWNRPFINGVNCGIFTLKFPFDIRNGHDQIINSTSLDFHFVLNYVIIRPSLHHHYVIIINQLTV